MKYIVCLGDGMADWPIKSLGDRTPLQAAKTPTMDLMAQQGQSGRVLTVPSHLKPGSDVANIGILGYDPSLYYTGRAPIEAASMGLRIPDGQLAFRCNLVTIQEDVMVDFTAEHVSSAEGEALLATLNSELSFFGVQFFPGVSYRNLALWDDRLAALSCTPPHDVTDKEIRPYLPQGKGADRVAKLVVAARLILAAHPVNRARIDKGLLPVTDIWLWGQGKMPNLPLFETQHGLTGGMVTAVDLLKGIGQLIGFETPDVEGATGFLDTNYAGKVETGLRLLESHDFVFIHIEAPDEAGHMGREDLKVEAIEAFDSQVVSPILAYAKQRSDVRIMVLPDHPTPCALKTHTSDRVPFLIYGAGISAGLATAFNETEVSAALSFDTPWELLAYFLKK